MYFLPEGFRSVTVISLSVSRHGYHCYAIFCFSASPELVSEDMNRGVALQASEFFSVLLFINKPYFLSWLHNPSGPRLPYC
jgi:hypothetical protein